MARNKFITNILPHMDSIEWWKRQGATNQEIAGKLDVSYISFKDYLRRGRAGEAPYSTLSTLIDTVLMNLDDQVEAALFRKTQGYNVKVLKHIKHRINDYDEDTGKKIGSHEEIEEIEDEVHVAADTSAQIFWLSRRRPDKWPAKPTDHVEEDTNTGVIMMDGPDVQELQPTEEEKKALEAKFGSEAGI